MICIHDTIPGFKLTEPWSHNVAPDVEGVQALCEHGRGPDDEPRVLNAPLEEDD